MSKVFRGRFIAALAQELPQQMDKAFVNGLYKTGWVVYAKRPFTEPKSVVEYLGRYTHKIAISNHRILNLKDGKVTFSYKDYKHGSVKKEMTLEAMEFIRRFCLAHTAKRVCQDKTLRYTKQQHKRKKRITDKRSCSSP